MTDEIKEAAQKDMEEQAKIYQQVLDNPSLESLANHIVNLYEADAQSMRQEIINAGMFKTLLDILVEKGVTTTEDIDTQLAANIQMIEDAYAEQYRKFEELIAEQQ